MRHCDDLVARTDSVRAESERKRARSRRASDDVAAPGEVRHAGLEVPNLWAVDVLPMIDHASDGLENRFAIGLVLSN